MLEKWSKAYLSYFPPFCSTNDNPTTNSDPAKPVAKKRRQSKKTKEGQDNETQPKKRRTKKKKLEINTSAASANVRNFLSRFRLLKFIN